MQNTAGPATDRQAPRSPNAGGAVSLEEAAVRGYRVRARSDSSLRSRSSGACASSASLLQRRLSISCSAATSAASSERQLRGERAARRLMHYQCAFVQLVHDQIQRFDSAWEEWHGGEGGGGGGGAGEAGSAAPTPTPSRANSLQNWNTRGSLHNVNQQASDLQNYQYDTFTSGNKHYHLPSTHCGFTEMENHSWEASHWCPHWHSASNNTNETLLSSNLYSLQQPILLHNQDISETFVTNSEPQQPQVYESPYVCELYNLEMTHSPGEIYNTSSKQIIEENVSFPVDNTPQPFLPPSHSSPEELRYEKWQKSPSYSEWRETEVKVHSGTEEQQTFLKASQLPNEVNGYEMNAPSQIENYLEWRNGDYSDMEKRGIFINDGKRQSNRNFVHRKQRKDSNTYGYFYPETPVYHTSNSSSNKTDSSQSQTNTFPMQPATNYWRYSRNKNTQTACSEQLNDGNIPKPCVKRGNNGDKKIACRDPVLSIKFKSRERKIQKPNHNPISHMQKNKKLKLNELLINAKPNEHATFHRQENEKKCVAAINENSVRIQCTPVMSQDPNIPDKTPFVCQPEQINFDDDVEHETAFENYSKCRQWNSKELDVVEDSKEKEKWICVPFTNITRQKIQENLVVSLDDQHTPQTRTYAEETLISEEMLENKHNTREECDQNNTESFASNRTQIPIKKLEGDQSKLHKDLHCLKKKFNENTHSNEEEASQIVYHQQLTKQNTKDSQSSWEDRMGRFQAPENQENSTKCPSETDTTDNNMELHSTIKKIKSDQIDKWKKRNNKNEKKLTLLPQQKSVTPTNQENDSSVNTVLIESNQKQNLSKQMESMELNKIKLKPIDNEEDVFPSDQNLKIMNEHNSKEISYESLSSSTTSDYARHDNTITHSTTTYQPKYMDHHKEYLHHKNKNEVSVIWHRNADKKTVNKSKQGFVGGREYEKDNAENELNESIVCKKQTKPMGCTLQHSEEKSSENSNFKQEEIKNNTTLQNQGNKFPGNDMSDNCDESFNSITPTKEMNNLEYPEHAPKSTIVILPVESKITVISNDQTSEMKKNDTSSPKNKACHSEIISFESVVDTSITDSHAQQNEKSFTSSSSRTDCKEFDVIFHISDTSSIHGTKNKNPGRNLEFSQTHDKALPCRRRTPYSIVYRFSPPSSKNYSKKQTQYKENLEESEATTSSTTSVTKVNRSLHYSDEIPCAKERERKKMPKKNQQNLKFDREVNIIKRFPNKDILGKRSSPSTKQMQYQEITRETYSSNEQFHCTTKYTEKNSEIKSPQAQILEHDPNPTCCSRSLMRETLHSIKPGKNEIIIGKKQYQNTKHPNHVQQLEGNIQLHCLPVKEKIAMISEHKETNNLQMKISNTEMHSEQPIHLEKSMEKDLNLISVEDTNLRHTSLQPLFPSEEVIDTGKVNAAEIKETETDKQIISKILENNSLNCPTQKPGTNDNMKLIQYDTFDVTKSEDKAENKISYKTVFQSNQYVNESSSFKKIVCNKLITGRDGSKTIPITSNKEAVNTKDTTMTSVSLSHIDSNERHLPSDKKVICDTGFPEKREQKQLYLHKNVLLKNKRISKKVMSNGRFDNHSPKNEILLKEIRFFLPKQLRGGCKLSKKKGALTQEKVKSTTTSTRKPNMQDTTRINEIIPEIKGFEQQNDSLTDVNQEERGIKHTDLSVTGVYYESSTHEAMKEIAPPNAQKIHLKGEEKDTTDTFCIACPPGTSSRESAKECFTLLHDSKESQIQKGMDYQIISLNENSQEGNTMVTNDKQQKTKIVQSTALKQNKIKKYRQKLRNNISQEEDHSLQLKETMCSQVTDCQKGSPVLENITSNNYDEQKNLSFPPAEVETISSAKCLDEVLTHLNKKRISLKSGRDVSLKRDDVHPPSTSRMERENHLADSDHELNLINHSFELPILPTVPEESENSDNSSENQEIIFPHDNILNITGVTELSPIYPLQQSSPLLATHTLVNSSESVATQCSKMINQTEQQSSTLQKNKLPDDKNYVLIENGPNANKSATECKISGTTNLIHSALACHVNNEITTDQPGNTSFTLQDKPYDLKNTLPENNNALSTLKQTLIQVAKAILNENIPHSYNDLRNKHKLRYVNFEDIPATKISTLKQITKQLFTGELQPAEALSSFETTSKETSKICEVRQYKLVESTIDSTEKSVKEKIHQQFQSDNLSKTKHALIHAARGIVYGSVSHTINMSNTHEKNRGEYTDLEDFPQDKINILKQIARELLQKELVSDNKPTHSDAANHTSPKKCGNIPCFKVNSEVSQRTTPSMNRRQTSSETKMTAHRKVHKKKRTFEERESFTRKIKQMAKSFFSNFTAGAKGDFIPFPAQVDKSKDKDGPSNTGTTHNHSFNSKLSCESFKKQTYVPPFLYKTFHPALKNEQICHETQKDFIVAHLSSISQNIQASLTPVIEENEDFLQGEEEEGDEELAHNNAMREMIPSQPSQNIHAPKADYVTMPSEQSNSKILLCIHSDIPKDSTSQTWQVSANNVNQSKTSNKRPFIPKHTISKPVFTSEEITPQRNLMLYDHAISDPNCSCEEYLHNSLHELKIPVSSVRRDLKERNEYTATYENPYCMPVICCPHQFMHNEIINPILDKDFEYIPRVSSQIHDVTVVSTQDTSTQITFEPNLNDDLNIVQVFIPQNSLTHNIECQNNSETSVGNEINIDIGIRTIIPNSSTHQSCEICTPCPTQYLSSDNSNPFLETTQHIIARIRFESEQQPIEEEEETDQILYSLIEKLFGYLELSRKRAICTIVKKIIKEIFAHENRNTCEKILLLHIIETFIAELPESLPLEQLLAQIENFMDEVFENENKCPSERQPMSELLHKSLQKIKDDFKSDSTDKAIRCFLKQKTSEKQFTSQIEDFVGEISSHFKAEPREKIRIITLLDTFIDKVFKSLKNEQYFEKSKLSVIEDFLEEVAKMIRMNCNEKQMMFSVLDAFIDQVKINLEKCCSRSFPKLIEEFIEEISKIVELKPHEKQKLTSVLKSLIDNMISKNLEIKQELIDEQPKSPHIKTEHLGELPENVKIKKEPLEQLTPHSEKLCSRKSCPTIDHITPNICTKAPKQNLSVNDGIVKNVKSEPSDSSFSPDESFDGLSEEDPDSPPKIKNEERCADICPCPEAALSSSSEKKVEKVADNVKYSSSTSSSISKDVSTRKRKKREISVSSRSTSFYEPPQRSTCRKHKLWCLLLLLFVLVIIPITIFCGATLALVTCRSRSCSEDWPTFTRLLLWNPLFGTLSHKNVMNVHGVF